MGFLSKVLGGRNASVKNLTASPTIDKSVPKELSQLDQDGSGDVDRQELQAYIEENTELWDMLSAQCNISEAQCREIARDTAYQMAKLTTLGEAAGFQDLKGYDLVREPTISEFTAFHSKLKNDPDYSLQFFHRTIFCAFDYDNNGYIEENEIGDFVKLFYNAQSVYSSRVQVVLPPKKELTKRILHNFDKNNDGRLDFHELQPLISGGAEALELALENDTFNDHEIEQQHAREEREREAQEKKEREENERRAWEKERELEREQAPSPTFEDMYLDDDDDDEESNNNDCAVSAAGSKSSSKKKSKKDGHTKSPKSPKKSRKKASASKTKEQISAPALDGEPKSPKKSKKSTIESMPDAGDSEKEMRSSKSRKSLSKKEASSKNIRSSLSKAESSKSFRKSLSKGESSKSFRKSLSKTEPSSKSTRKGLSKSESSSKSTRKGLSKSEPSSKSLRSSGKMKRSSSKRGLNGSDKTHDDEKLRISTSSKGSKNGGSKGSSKSDHRGSLKSSTRSKSRKSITSED